MQAFQKYIKARQPESVRLTAEHLGVSRSFVYDLKSGRREPNLETAQQIERATGGKVPVNSWDRYREIEQALSRGAA